MDSNPFGEFTTFPVPVVVDGAEPSPPGVDIGAALITSGGFGNSFVTVPDDMGDKSVVGDTLLRRRLRASRAFFIASFSCPVGLLV
jgi:hypothetical protein